MTDLVDIQLAEQAKAGQDAETYRQYQLALAKHVKDSLPVEPVTQSLRHRINVSVSVKGVPTWDCTVDGTGFTMEEILAESDLLVAQLRDRYTQEV